MGHQSRTPLTPEVTVFENDCSIWAMFFLRNNFVGCFLWILHLCKIKKDETSKKILHKNITKILHLERIFQFFKAKSSHLSLN